MKPLWVDQLTLATGLAALLFALFLGYAGDAAAQCTSVPCMTIKIYNNSDTSNIYPVLSSGTAVPDLYLQAALMVPKAQLGTHSPSLTNFDSISIPRETGFRQTAMSR